ATADHRLRCRPSEIESLLASLLDAVRGGRSSPSPAWLAAAAADLRAHAGRSLVVAGDPAATITSLVDKMEAGAVDTVVCIGGNPSYATPASLRLSSLLRRVPNS